MKCRHCGARIPDRRRICPFCQQEPRRQFKPIHLLLIAGIVVLLVLLYFLVWWLSREDPGATLTLLRGASPAHPAAQSAGFLRSA